MNFLQHIYGAKRSTDPRYQKLYAMKLSENQLRTCHYPRPHPRYPDRAQVFNIETSYYRVVPGPFKRNCKRCFKVYNIGSDGVALANEQCNYHPFRLGGGRYPTFRCCQKDKHGSPCATASRHISDDIDPDNLNGFLTTTGNRRVTSEGIYALDCEMVCTKAGLELACISVVDDSTKVVYETMVLPDNPIIDCVTDHSNLTAGDFRGVTTKLKDVHEKLFTLFGEQTILVGHGMNNDMLKLKLFHDNIVDTSVAYPHLKGGRFRNSLSFLRERYLPHSFVGTSNVAKCRGDALASMKLALMKCV